LSKHQEIKELEKFSQNKDRYFTGLYFWIWSGDL